MDLGFDRLLDVSVRYLEELKRGGHRYVRVASGSLELLGALTRPAVVTGEGPVSGDEQLPGASARGRANGVRDLAAEPVAKLETIDEIRESAPLHGGGQLSGAAKAAAVADLRERALACVKCPHLVRARRRVVFGVGNIDAELMFVGEAPGLDEDQAGEPFVGRAGQLLTKIIETMGMTRSEVYIANILKCRPDTPGQSAGNRKPTAEEMRTCIPYLHAQIDLIGPKVLVALGATAMEGLLGKTAGITRLRGQWHAYRNIPLMPTYHPAYLLRNQSLQEKRRIWEDMLAVMQRMGRPVTEKQRGFFLGK